MIIYEIQPNHYVNFDNALSINTENPEGVYEVNITSVYGVVRQYNLSKVQFEALLSFLKAHAPAS